MTDILILDGDMLSVNEFDGDMINEEILDGDLLSEGSLDGDLYLPSVMYDHTQLKNRDRLDQHPQRAITNLVDDLAKCPSEKISDAEIELLE